MRIKILAVISLCKTIKKLVSFNLHLSPSPVLPSQLLKQVTIFTSALLVSPSPVSLGQERRGPCGACSVNMSGLGPSPPPDYAWRERGLLRARREAESARGTRRPWRGNPGIGGRVSSSRDVPASYIPGFRAGNGLSGGRGLGSPAPTRPRGRPRERPEEQAQQCKEEASKLCSCFFR